MQLEAEIALVDPERLYRHVYNLEGIKHSLISPQALKKAENYIKNEFQQLGVHVQDHFFEVKGVNQRYRNIQGFLRDLTDPNPDNPLLLIASHHDTVYNSPGADDNASAIAVMLETARIFQKINLNANVAFISFNLEEGSPYLQQAIWRLGQDLGVLDGQHRFVSWQLRKAEKRLSAKKMQLGPEFYRDSSVWEEVKTELVGELSSEEVEFFENRHRLIRNMFGTATTTSIGTIGSIAWVDRAINKGMEILGILNLEMVGYVSKKRNSQKVPSLVSPEWFKKYQVEDSLSVGDFIAVISNSESANLEQKMYEGAMMDAIQLPYASLTIPFDYDTINQTAWHLLRSDHAPFWKHNIPGLLITDTGNFRNPYYHTGADCIQTLDSSFMKKVCQTIITASINLAK